MKIRNNTKQGYLEAEKGDGIDISNRMIHHRGTVQKKLIQTLQTKMNVGVIRNGNERERERVSVLTPLEALKYMGFEESDYLAMRDAKMSDTTIYKLAGDSIVSTCIMALFSEMLDLDHKEIINNYVGGLVNGEIIERDTK